MGPLKLLLIAVSLAVPSPAAADPLDRWAAPIAEASSRFGIPADWIKRVMRAESGGRMTLGGRPIVSRAGAMGLMQLMPGTWRDMRALLGLGPDPHDPRDNILAGTAYLRAMYDRFGYPGLFAAYNAGPRRYAEHLATGRRLPRETIAYVAAVTGIGTSLPAGTPGPARVPALFAIRAGSDPSAATAGDEAPPTASTGLFVPLDAAIPR